MSIEPTAYWQDSWLEREYEQIFARRMFIDKAEQWGEDGDYVAYRVCTRPLVTRKLGASLATFDNVCLHRANLIDPEGQGNRPFRCGYHGWQYGADGALLRAPLANEACIARRQLARHRTRQHGGLVFVDGDGALPGPGAAALADIGFQPGPVFHRESLPHRANWKLLVENVLESYHLSFVHQDSFVPTGLSSASACSNAFMGADSSFHIANRAGERSTGRVIEGAGNGYAHAYVFPNLFVSVTGGLVGFLSHFKPNAPDQTVLEWELFETPLLLEQKKPVRDYIKRNAIAFTRQVLGEDLAVLESSQLGVRHARGPHQLQDGEARVRHFHQTYLEWMS
jgi:phenylpropionate dioxygenase-like ring-hydroxylating dioxygenase large terminal subunit